MGEKMNANKILVRQHPWKIVTFKTEEMEGQH